MSLHKEPENVYDVCESSLAPLFPGFWQITKYNYKFSIPAFVASNTENQDDCTSLVHRYI